MADIEDLNFDTDEVVAAEDGSDKLFESVNSVVNFVTVDYTVLTCNLLTQRSLASLLR